MNNTGKKVVGTLASLSLLTGGVVAAMPMINAAVDGNAVADEASSEIQSSSLVKVAGVQGQFAYEQNSVTPNSKIATVFQRASQAMCNTVSKYQDQVEWAIDVSGDVPNSYSATLSDLAEEEGVVSYIMGCACSANQAGGGAAINAEAGGVSFESIAQRAGVK